MTCRSLFVLLATVSVGTSVFAQNATESTVKSGPTREAMLKDIVEKEAAAQKAKELLIANDKAAAAPKVAKNDDDGAGKKDAKNGPFGNMTAGIAAFYLGKKNEIVDATIENGIVRVKEKRSMRAGPWLQTTWVSDVWSSTSVRPGFFLGAELGGDNLVRSVGTGFNFQFRVSPKEPKGAINVGLGIHWTTIQVLGAGLVENQQVDPGTESIRYRKESQPGVVVNVSFTL